MKYELVSNNSMALRIRYEFFFYFFFFFQNIRLCIERVVWEKGHFQFYLNCRGPISASQTFFLLTPEAINNIYVMEEYKKRNFGIAESQTK